MWQQPYLVGRGQKAGGHAVKLKAQGLPHLNRLPHIAGGVQHGKGSVVKHTRLIASSIPGSTLAILPGDHFVARRNWRAFNPVVLKFLEE